MAAVSRLRLLAVAGLAWAGMVVGHLLAYRLVYPSMPHRLEHLMETGHGAFPLPMVCALACAPALLMAVAAAYLAGGGDLRPTVMWLAAIQVPSFALLELAERHFVIDLLLREPAFYVGVGVQLAIAAIASALVRVVVRAIRVLVGWRRRTIRAPAVVAVPALAGWATPRRDFLVSLRHRAPPLGLAA